MKFLDRKIPKSPKQAAALLNASAQNPAGNQSKATVSRYDQAIRHGKMHVDDSQDPKFGEQKPEFWQNELRKQQELA